MSAELGPDMASLASCATCGGSVDANAAAMSPGATSAYVYARGRIEPRFPNLAAEKEFVQATGRADTVGQTDQQAFQAVLAKRENRYLARQMCWVLTIQGLDAYVLVPRDSLDLALLVDAIRSAPGPGDIDVVIGTRGPMALPGMCNGLIVPIVVFDQIYSFDRAELLQAIPEPDGAPGPRFIAAAEELLDRLFQIPDNLGATGGDRALTYLTMRYSDIYTFAANQFERDYSLSGVDIRPSPLSATRQIIDVVFAYTNRKTEITEKFFVRVDVTEEFPFLVTKLSPYYSR